MSRKDPGKGQTVLGQQAQRSGLDHDVAVVVAFETVESLFRGRVGEVIAREKCRVTSRVDHHTERACGVSRGVYDAHIRGHLSCARKRETYMRGGEGMGVEELKSV